MSEEVSLDEQKHSQPQRFLSDTRQLVRVDSHLYQAVIPEIGSGEKSYPKLIHSANWVAKQSSQFKQDLEDYLQFADQLFNQEGKPVGLEISDHQRTIYSSDGLIIGGAQIAKYEVHERAIGFLAKMKQDFLRAKFYLLFPTLMVYRNIFPMKELSRQQMQEAIDNHIARLNEDKASLETKWKQELNDLLSYRPKATLTQFQSYIEQGIQLKYDVPEQFRQVLQQAILASKGIAKLIREKQTIQTLKQYYEQVEQLLPIVTPELANLKDIISRIDMWMSKISHFPDHEDQDYEDFYKQLLADPSREKIPFKTLKSLVAEYKTLPIQSDWFEQVHRRVFDYAKELIERLGKTTKVAQSKTRSQIQVVCQNDKNDRLTLTQASQLVTQIEGLVVTCEEFEAFIEQYYEAQELHERCCMYIEDNMRDFQGSILTIQLLLKEVVECQFMLEVQDRLQDSMDYMVTFEKIKKTLNDNKVDLAYLEIQEAKERGFFTEEMEQLESVLQQVLDWNQKAQKYIDPFEQFDIIDVYENKIYPQNYDFLNLLPIDPLIEKFIDGQKITNIKGLMVRSIQWEQEITQIMDQSAHVCGKQLQRVKILWALIKEGLTYFRHQSILQAAITLFVVVIEWCAQVYQITQNLEEKLDTEEEFSLIGQIGVENIEQIIQKDSEKYELELTMDLLLKLRQVDILLLKDSTEINTLNKLIEEAERWNSEAISLISQQVPFSADNPSSILQYENTICKLLNEAKYLTIDYQLVNQLDGIYEANKKATHIISIIHNVEPSFEPILKAVQNNPSYQDMCFDLQNILSNAQSFTPSKKKNSEQRSVSTVAKDFYKQHQNTLVIILGEIAKIDPLKLKKVLNSQAKVNKLKDMNIEFSSNCQSCPTVLKEGFEIIRNQLQQTLANYDSWVQKIQLLQSQEDSSNKTSKRKRKQRSESQNQQENDSVQIELEVSSPQLRMDLLYYFKLPQMLQLFVEASQQSFYGQEIFETWKFLQEIHEQLTKALEILNAGSQKTLSDLQQFSTVSVYLPQFHVLQKLLRLAQNWVNTAQYIINSTPRAKNLFVKDRMPGFIWNLHKFKVQPEQEPPSEVEDLVPPVTNIIKPKREKRLSKLMQDESMAFYDPNASLKKSFGSQDRNITQKDGKRKKKKLWTQKTKKPEKKLQQKLKRRVRESVTPLDLEVHNRQFLTSFRDSSSELQALYNYDKTYCICRQGSESQITDWNILKCMVENRVSDFYLLHLKLQESKKIMVCCDICNEWYHSECMGIRTHQMKQSEKYICRVCIHRQNPIFLVQDQLYFEQIFDEKNKKNQPEYETLLGLYQKQISQIEELLNNSGDIYYNRFQKSKLDNFIEFCQLGKKIPIQMVELGVIELIYERINRWIQKANRALELEQFGVFIAKQATVSQQSRQEEQLKEMIQLFSESLWFPVELRQSSQLLAKIHQISFVRKATDVLQYGRKNKSIKKNLLERTKIFYECFHRKSNDPINEEEKLVMSMTLDLLEQQNLNSQFEKEENALINLNPDLEDYEILCRNFERRVSQQNCRFVIPKLIEIKEKIQRAKGLQKQIKMQEMKDQEEPGGPSENEN